MNVLLAVRWLLACDRHQPLHPVLLCQRQLCVVQRLVVLDSHRCSKGEVNESMCAPLTGVFERSLSGMGATTTHSQRCRCFHCRVPLRLPMLVRSSMPLRLPMLLRFKRLCVFVIVNCRCALQCPCVVRATRTTRGSKSSRRRRFRRHGTATLPRSSRTTSCWCSAALARTTSRWVTCGASTSTRSRGRS